MLGRRGSGNSISPEIVQLYKALNELSKENDRFEKALSTAATANLVTLSEILQNGNGSVAIIQRAYPDDDQAIMQTSLSFPNLTMGKRIEEYLAKPQTPSQAMLVAQ